MFAPTIEVLRENVLNIFTLRAVNDDDELVRRLEVCAENARQTALKSLCRTEYRYDDVDAALPIDAIYCSRIPHWGKDTTRNGSAGRCPLFDGGVIRGSARPFSKERSKRIVYSM